MQISETSWQVSPSTSSTPRPVATHTAFAEVMDAHSPASSEPSPSPSLERLDRAAAAYRDDQQAIDVGIERFAHGGGSPADLLALQQRVSDASLKVELATRVVDRMASGCKQLLSIQV